MSREEYLNYRRKSEGLLILYNLVKEKAKVPFNTFVEGFNNWQIFPQAKQLLVNQAIDYYDKKFNVTILAYNDKFLKIY